MTEIVDRGREIEVTAEVGSVEELFEAPELNPFVEQARTAAVIDDIERYLHSRALRPAPAISLSLLLPAAQVHETLAEEIRAAVGRYSAHKLHELDSRKAAGRFEGRRRVPWGIGIVVAVSLVVAAVVALTPPSARPYLTTTLTPVATVAVWVALWSPLEMLLYDGWTMRRDRAVYRLLRDLEVRVQPK